MKNIEAEKQVNVAERLGKAEFVYWEDFSEDLIYGIMAIDDNQLNFFLKERFCEENPMGYFDMICSRFSDNRIGKYSRLLNQCRELYQNGDMDLVVMGLCSIMDGILSDVTGDDETVSIKGRISRIEAKMGWNEERENVHSNSIKVPGINMEIFRITFKKSGELFGESSNFSHKEPIYLNRDWIMHGRSTGEKTKLDCQKILRMIYGVLLIDDLSVNYDL